MRRMHRAIHLFVILCVILVLMALFTIAWLMSGAPS